MQPVRHAVISAAGLGSRLGLNLPKCLVELEGRRLIDYQLELLEGVPDVRIVVGFMERAVMEHVRSVRRDVIFVRNPDYVTTSNSYSLSLASRDLREDFLILDGDLILERESFQHFLSRVQPGRSLIGVTESKSEESVFVELDGGMMLHGFQRHTQRPYEWSGLAYLSGVSIEANEKYVFEELAKWLPLQACPIRCFEIDTPRDLSEAIRHFGTLGYGRG